MTDSPMTEIGFGRVAAMFPVKDMERACAFYVGVLGFTKTFENGQPATRSASATACASSRACATRATACAPSS